MVAISLIDNALWDLKGKWFKQSVSTLIGGSGRGPMTAYASMLGCATQDMGARERTGARDAKQGLQGSEMVLPTRPDVGSSRIQEKRRTCRNFT
jgi:L-alanine-DL-glutamate epimerase-like enolase superfamily enzyme